MTRREEIEVIIEVNRHQMQQVSQFELGGEGVIERLLAKEHDLYTELAALDAPMTEEQAACDHKALAPNGFIAHHGPCPDCGLYFETLAIFAEG